MGTPTKKRTSGQRKRRASHFAMTRQTINVCPQCGKDMRPHHACQHCGFYRGKEVVNTLKKADKKRSKPTAKK